MFEQSAAPDGGAGRTDGPQPPDRLYAEAPRRAWYPVLYLDELRPARSRDVRLMDSRFRITRLTHAKGYEVVEAAGGRRRPFPARHGLLWLCPSASPAAAPDIVEFHEGAEAPLIASATVVVEADFDQAVLGLVDPAHVPMVHTSWWWRPRSKPRRIKTKAYTPSPFGFTAQALDAFASAPVYALGGGAPDVAIEFRLPSTRLERIRWGRRQVFSMTTVTPEASRRMVIRTGIYGDLPFARVLKLVLGPVGHVFLKQDAGILAKLEPGAQGLGSQLFVGDPDMPSLWYFALKKKLLAAQAQERPFRNPVQPRTLRWRT